MKNLITEQLKSLNDDDFMRLHIAVLEELHRRLSHLCWLDREHIKQPLSTSAKDRQND
jgi:hypothetical protein